MAKRIADRQMTKETASSDEDGFSVGAQVGGAQRATTAQMASRKLAKVRGSRRPGASRLPPPSSASGVQQSLPSPFSQSNTNDADRTQQQQDPVGLFGQQPNSNSHMSASFPPFGASSKSNLNTPPLSSNGGFNFDPGQSQWVNNPFINGGSDPLPTLQDGFDGRIFHVPLSTPTSFQRFQEGQQKPLFASHSPFESGQQDTSAAKPPPSTNDSSGNSIDQKDSPTLGAAMFVPSTSQQPKTPPQPQPNSGSSLGQPSSIFSQPTKPVTNLFAHIGTPIAPSNFFGQSPALQAQPQQAGSPEDQTMMSASPDPSPQSRVFGFLNETNHQTQSSPTKGASAPDQGGSLFDRVTRPSYASNIQPSHELTDSSIPQSSNNIFNTAPLWSVSSQHSTQIMGPSNDAAQITNPAKTSFNTEHSKTTASDSSSTATFQPSSGGVFNNFKMPQPSRESLSSPAQMPEFFQSDRTSLLSQGSLNNASIQGNIGQVSASEGGREFGEPPPAPADWTVEEQEQLRIAWRLKQLDTFFQQYINNNPSKSDLESAKAWYQQQKSALIRDKGVMNQGPGAGSKRKATDEQMPEKKARTENSTQVARQTKTNVPDPIQPLFKQPLQPINANGKRNADQELERDTAQGMSDNGKKARSEDSASTPMTSETSSMFKNILDNKKPNTMVNGNTAKVSTQTSNLFQSRTSSSNGSGGTSSKAPLFKPWPTTSSPSKTATDPLLKPTSNSKAEGSVTPKSTLFPQQSTGTNTSITHQTSPLKTSDSNANSNPFAAKSSLTTTSVPSDPAQTPAFKVPTFDANTTSASGKSNPFVVKQTSSSSILSDTAKAPAFQVPKLGAGFAPNNLQQSGQKLSVSGSSNPFTLKSASTASIPSNTTKASAFQVPKFGTGVATNYLQQFGQKLAEDAKKKRKAEDFDSDEDNEAEWDRKDEEEQRAKKAKLEEEMKGKAPIFINGKFVLPSDEEKPRTSPSQNGSSSASISVFEKPYMPLPDGRNIFGHLSGEDSGAEGSKAGDADDEDDDEEEAKESLQPSTSSLFDRITKDENGKPMRDTSIVEVKSTSQTNNIFGLSQNNSNTAKAPVNFFTPINISNVASDKSSATPQSNIFGKTPSPSLNKNIFGLPSSSGASDAAKVSQSSDFDHTWKADSPIKFGGAREPPTVNITSPSPSKAPFTGLFGAPKPAATPETPAKSATSLFSTTSTKSPSVGLGFGFVSSNATSSSLVPPSKDAPGMASRATSPGVTTGESANESLAEKEGEIAPQDEQLDLTIGGPGEEHEDIVFQAKARASVYEMDTKTWSVKGLGPFRIMKHRETGKIRMLMRQEPSGKVVINASLSSSFQYQSLQEKTVRIPIVESGKPRTWAIKVGKDEDAKSITKILEDNKAN